MSGAFVGVVAVPARVSTLDFVGLSCCFDCFFHIIPKKFVSNWDIDIATYGPHVFGQGWFVAGISCDRTVLAELCRAER